MQFSLIELDAEETMNKQQTPNLLNRRIILCITNILGNEDHMICNFGPEKTDVTHYIFC